MTGRITADEAKKLPTGSVVRCVAGRDDRGVYVRHGVGDHKWGMVADDGGAYWNYPVDGDYEVLYEPPAPPVKVGDVIPAGRFTELPIGSIGRYEAERWTHTLTRTPDGAWWSDFADGCHRSSDLHEALYITRDVTVIWLPESADPSPASSP